MALLGSDAHQLDRLGRELKCPICLSLFKEAASLTCNHSFCRSCIIQSMKSNSACPICKVHTTRREVRAAPQMDSLVSIFVSMGGAAGLDIMASQNVTIGNEAVQAQTSKAGISKGRDALSNITNFPDSRQKTKKKAKSPDCIFKGAIPAKKRIQVPEPSSLGGEFEAHKDKNHHNSHSSAEKGGHNVLSGGSRSNTCKRKVKEKEPPSEAEVANCISSSSRRAAKRAKSQNPSIEQACSKAAITEESDKEGKSRKPSTEPVSNTTKTRKRKGKEVMRLPCSQPSSHHAKEIAVMPVKDDSSRRKLDPFFWLRDESSQDTEALQITQLTVTQSTVRPNFSDLKDSDDDQDVDANEEFSNRIGDCMPASYDSDDFDWTQLPCSPEIKCSPIKDQGPQNDLVVDLPLETSQLVATEGLPNNDQNLHNRASQEIISTKSLVDTVSRVALIAQDNHSTFLKQNRKRRKSGRLESVLLKPDKSLVSVCSSKNSAKSSQNQSVEERQIIVRGCNGFQTAKQSPPTTNLAKEMVQFNLKACSSKKTEKLKEPYRSKMELIKEDDGKKSKNLIEGSEKADNVAESQLSVCVFCRSSKSSQITGPMMHYNREGTPLKEPELKEKIVHVHKHCAEWAPDVYFVEDQAKNLHVEVARGLKIKCSSCGKRGAALGCCIKRCRKSYHYPCARALSCRWEEECFIMLCPEHRAESFPARKRRQRGLSKAAHNPRSKLKAGEQGHSGSQEMLSPRWACVQSSKWLLCGSALDSDGKNQLAAFAKITGATVSKAWSSNVTHVIAGVDEQGAARRTMKYLMAILEGKWILNMEWVAACLEAGNPVSEEPYEIGVDIHGALGGPKQGRLAATGKEPKLFGKMQFYFMPDFSPSYRGDLQALVVAGGGVILQRKPVLLETDARQRTTVVVYHNESPSNVKKVEERKIVCKRQEEAKRLALSVGASVVPHQWILDCIGVSKVLSVEHQTRVS
ncbi:hypothetical protein GOP47_0012625 [Adiantum capillus-veneris]|uniref:RING-type E3 ubiquitin transferase BRCA1 n=1 Tax=Adiantum capillus-veneris TaxID=13818 RepID=A0A9D4ZEK9_ADICA|nr:hypothetical protein GOP47_0012625 [Adiantum capillus-veneris]